VVILERRTRLPQVPDSFTSRNVFTVHKAEQVFVWTRVRRR
jgi:hypothetical protein